MKAPIYRSRVVAFSLLALLFPHQLFAQQASAQPSARKFELTVDSIMRGPELVGYPPSDVRWSRDSRRVYFRWKQPQDVRWRQADLYVVNRDGSGLRKLSEEEARHASPDAGELSRDKKFTVFVEDGDIFLYDHDQGERRQLTSTSDAETNAHFTRDQRRVYFTRQNNLYVLSLADGSLVQMTDIRAAGAGGARAAGGSQQRGTDSQEFIKKEERELIEAVRERAAQREAEEARRKQRERRKPFQLAANQSVFALMLSPDEKQVVAAISEPGQNAKSTIVPSYVTESAYTEDLPARTKVGDAQGRTRLAVLSVEDGEAKFVETGLPPAKSSASNAANNAASAQTTSVQTEARQETKPETKPEAKAEAKPAEREVRFFALQWAEDGSRLALLARAADNKDRWVMTLDPAAARMKVVDHLHDDAWVGGPGEATLGWMPDGKRVYYQSERDGYSHLYVASGDGGEPTQLTAGKFEVSDVRLSEDKRKFYFTSSEGSSFERHLYSMPVTGGERTRITSIPGSNQAAVSPDDAMLAIIRSYSNKPPEVYFVANSPGAEAKQITTSPTPEFFSYNWIDPPIVHFKARDGADVPARLYRPANFKPGGPAVIFVHGAGYLQNVHRWWSSYFREYMFHHLLMDRGFVVLDVDYRASAGYGRDWRTGIYRHMGGKDLTDQIDAARWLVSQHGVDAKRIGIYGGSYGGFITLMAMFTEPDVFAAGAALRPVTDWAHYNHPYTSNILNTPQADAEAYRRSSPIYHAQGLKGALLICHGMVDVNVHFQDTVRLVQRLIELRKENWELAVYPVEDHAFERASSWADEYKRILNLFTEHLQAKAVRAAGRGKAKK
jgi:dipeptidyl aminopeptidase/acylaminoacyl peptidase